MRDQTERKRQPKLRCPHCGDYDSLVRPKWLPQPEDGSVYRRVRECQRCHVQYATIEQVEKSADLNI
jgi:transcriptional regulator NrdR family protein